MKNIYSSLLFYCLLVLASCSGCKETVENPVASPETVQENETGQFCGTYNFFQKEKNAISPVKLCANSQSELDARAVLVQKASEKEYKSYLETLDPKKELLTNQVAYNELGFNEFGFDREGYDKDGYDARGFDRKGLYKGQSPYDEAGYDKDCFSIYGFDPYGFDKYGKDMDGQYAERGENAETDSSNGRKCVKRGTGKKRKPGQRWCEDGESEEDDSSDDNTDTTDTTDTTDSSDDKDDKDDKKTYKPDAKRVAKLKELYNKRDESKFKVGFDMDEDRRFVVTAKDEAFFWSGRSYREAGINTTGHPTD